MIASTSTIKVGNTVIFKCDEYRNKDVQEFDGFVQLISDKGVDVCYLNGYRSRNDFIPFCNVIAKVDKRKPWVSLKGDTPYSGHFVEFDELVEEK